MYISIIKVDVIRISIINSIIRFFKSRSTVSRVSIVGVRGSGGAGKSGISLLGFFWGFRDLIMFKKGWGALEGEDWSLMGRVLGSAGAVLLAAPRKLSAFCSTEPCRASFASGLGSKFPGSLVPGAGPGSGGFVGLGARSGLVSAPRNI